MPDPLLLRPEDGDGEPIVDTPARELRILCDHEWLTLTWTRHAAGERGAEPHVHREHADAFYVLAGEITVRLGAGLEPVTATAGTMVVIPPGVIHGFDNDGPDEARFLNFHGPDGGFAQYLRTHEPFDSFDPPEDGGRPAGDAIVTPPGGGERFRREDRVITILGDLPEISFFRLEVEPEWPGIGEHDHEVEVDTFFVLDGESGFLLGEEVVRAGAGTFYGAAPGIRHGVVHDHGHATYLNVHGPDNGFAEWVRSQ